MWDESHHDGITYYSHHRNSINKHNTFGTPKREMNSKNNNERRNQTEEVALKKRRIQIIAVLPQNWYNIGLFENPIQWQEN